MNKNNTADLINLVCNAISIEAKYARNANRETLRSNILKIGQKFVDEYAEGAIFYGPLSVKRVSEREWKIKDLRGGWGFYPIELSIISPTLPTKEDVTELLMNEIQHAQHVTEALEDIKNFINK